MSRLRAKCPDCQTHTAVALGPDYECHVCGRTFTAGLLRVPRAWGEGGDAMAEAAMLPFPLPEAAVVAEDSLHEQNLAIAAEEVLRTGYAQLEEMGGLGPQVNVATLLARVRLQRGRNDDAEEITRTCERLAAPDQADAQVKWRSIRAMAVARRGDPGEAERLAREAVYLADKTDQLDSLAEAHLDLAEVLLLGGRGREAEQELERAISLYQEKGNEVGERNALRLLARTRG